MASACLLKEEHYYLQPVLPLSTRITALDCNKKYFPPGGCDKPKVTVESPARLQL